MILTAETECLNKQTNLVYYASDEAWLFDKRKNTPTTMTLTPNLLLLSNLKKSVSDPVTFAKATNNFITTFTRLNIGSQAEKLASYIFKVILEAGTIEEAERKVRVRFNETRTDDGKKVSEMIEAGLNERFKLMFSQLQPHLKGIDNMIDYGCGSGTLTQMIHDRLGMQIEGVDIRDFRARHVTVPVRHFDGRTVRVEDNHYQGAVLTNVIHHEARNECILEELTRIAKFRLVIIETVPEGSSTEDTQADWGRMLLNDALWNRFFNRANIPCPGTYETPAGWQRRLGEFGWHLSHSEDLGFDQPTIQDRHHLLVFES